MAHRHDHCEHDKSLVYCKDCQVIYCRSCKAEWSTRPCERRHADEWWMSYPFYSTGYVVKTTQDNVDLTPTITCSTQHN